MDLSEIAIDILIGIIYAAPWLVAIILASKMLKQSGGKPERFLLIGASLMLVTSVFATVVNALQPHLIVWFFEAGHDLSNTEWALVSGIIGTVRACITLAGISFLVYAFWTKFHART
jgi:hypothetical protein